MIHSLIVMADSDTINVFDLPALMRGSVPPRPDLTRSLADVEAEYIANVLASVAGNRTKAAQILGIDRKTLREKLKSRQARNQAPFEK